MQIENLPKISVVLPVYNSVNTIEKAICSILNQNYANLQLIVIDGGSQDGTVDIIKKYENQIYYWHSKRDGSCGRAINLGLQQATGDLTAQLMGDDWFEPNTFHAIAAAFQKNLNADMISCGGRIVEQDGEQLKVLTSYTTPQQLEMSVYNMCFALPAMSSRFITKKMYDKVGLLDPLDKDGKHLYSADREMLLRMAVHGCKNVIIDHLGHSYFAHKNSATFGNNFANQLKIYREHMTMVENYFRQYQLPAEHRQILCSWYNDQSARLFLYKLKLREWNSAWSIAQSGWKLTKMRWPISLIYTPCQVMVKRLALKLTH